MRSWLFVPGDSADKITKAISLSGADVVILDLEDSVSADNKARARETAAKALATQNTGTCQLYVRLNAFDSGLIEADLAAILPQNPDGLMLPKAQSGNDVEKLAQRADTQIAIIAIATETAASLFNLGTYAKLGANLCALTWGAEDLSSCLGASTSRDKNGHLTHPYQLARSLCLCGAVAAEVQPVDTVYTDFRNLDGLKAECAEAARDGFTGKMAIHPAQVPVINRMFTPSADEVEHARTVVEAFEAAGNPGVLAINGQMFDRPHLERARKTLKRAHLAPAVLS